MQQGRVPIDSDWNEQDVISEHERRLTKLEIRMNTLEKILRDSKIEENKIINELKRLQRIYQISSSNDVLSKLLNDGLDSARDIVQCNIDRIDKLEKRIDGLEKSKSKK